MVTNLVGFTVYGDYRQSNPAARIVEAVARDKVDIAIVWGPVAGYFAPRQPVPLTILPLPPGSELNQPFTFSIAMAVRKTDKPLRDALNHTLARRAMVIAKILREYGVPMVEGGTNTQAGL